MLTGEARTSMAIQWPKDDDRPKALPHLMQRSGPMVGGLVQVRDGDLPSARRPRDVLVVLVLIGLAVLIGVLLWTLGPVPRVFPLMS